MAEQTDLQKDLAMLSAEIKRLEAEYNMFFAGRLPRPPWETRGRVEAMIKRYDRGHIIRTADRFQFEMLQTRFQKMSKCGIAGCGRGKRDGPGRSRSRRPKAPPPPAGRRQQQGPARHRVEGSAPRDGQGPRALRLADGARRGLGEDVVPFHGSPRW